METSSSEPFDESMERTVPVKCLYVSVTFGDLTVPGRQSAWHETPSMLIKSGIKLFQIQHRLQCLLHYHVRELVLDPMPCTRNHDGSNVRIRLDIFDKTKPVDYRICNQHSHLPLLRDCVEVTKKVPRSVLLRVPLAEVYRVRTAVPAYTPDPMNGIDGT